MKTLESTTDVRGGCCGAAPCSAARSKYKTIVADPPWALGTIPGRPTIKEGAMDARKKSSNGEYERGATARRGGLGYNAMTNDEIIAMPVRELGDDNSHLYLWTINRYLLDGTAYKVARAWGYKPVQILTWAKKPRGIMLGAYTSTTEFVLFCRRGTLKSLRQVDTTWWNWPRHNKHSKKPEHFQDIVETVSPGPYLELFARRKRLGWHAWGNEVPCDVAIVTPNDKTQAPT